MEGALVDFHIKLTLILQKRLDLILTSKEAWLPGGRPLLLQCRCLNLEVIMLKRLNYHQYNLFLYGLIEI